MENVVNMGTGVRRLAVAALLLAAPAGELAFGHEAELFVGYAHAGCDRAPYLFTTDMGTIRSEAAHGRLRSYGRASRGARDIWVDIWVAAARVEAAAGERAKLERRASLRALAEAESRLPKDATVQWCRSMTRKVGASRNTARRTWRARGPQPHPSPNFKPSAIPRLEEKPQGEVAPRPHPREDRAVRGAGRSARL